MKSESCSKFGLCLTMRISSLLCKIRIWKTAVNLSKQVKRHEFEASANQNVCTQK